MDRQVSASWRNQLCRRMQAQLAPSQRVARLAHWGHTARREAARAPQLRASGLSRSSMQAALSSANGNGAHLAEHSERITQLEDELTAERHKARARRRTERRVPQLTLPPASGVAAAAAACCAALSGSAVA